jgi:hypothetical protein
VTSRTDYSAEDWKLVLEGPTAAALFVLAADGGIPLSDALLIGEAYSDLRKQPVPSELVSAILGERPAVEHTRFHSPEEFRQACLVHLRAALEIVATHAASDEFESYKRFIRKVCDRAERAQRESRATLHLASGKRTALAEVRRELDLD